MNSHLLSQLAKARTDELLRRAEEQRRVVPAERSKRRPTVISRLIGRARRSEPAATVDRWLAKC